MRPIAILGAGNGGCALAAHLTMLGLEIHLCEIYSPQRIEDLKKRGGIELAGVAGEGFAVPKLMTTNFEEAIKDIAELAVKKDPGFDLYWLAVALRKVKDFPDEITRWPVEMLVEINTRELKTQFSRIAIEVLENLKLK